MLKLYSPAHGQRSAMHTERVRRAICAHIFGDERGGIGDEICVNMEYCFRVIFDEKNCAASENTTVVEAFWRENRAQLAWIFTNKPFEMSVSLAPSSSIVEDARDDFEFLLEIGSRPTMTTPFSTNAAAVLRAACVDGVERVEKSRLYRIRIINDKAMSFDAQSAKLRELFVMDSLLDICGDRMTECIYDTSTDARFAPKAVSNAEKKGKFNIVNVLDAVEGEKNLRDANAKLALGFDASDFCFYLELFRDKLKRNPTDVELFDLAQSNSEHSRHWFFKGDITVDGKQRNESLFSSIQNTQEYSNANNVIAFSDNSSAIKGFETRILSAQRPDACSQFQVHDATRHIVYTAETHNFPTGVCPFPGASTGVGGRIRDVHATGRGAHEIAGVAGYSVGNLNLSDYVQPWEHAEWTYPTRAFASPAKILLDASDGASDYGNKFGEPLICGFTRTFGMLIPSNSPGDESGERVEYVKPIMFSGGIGAIDAQFLRKVNCERGQIVAKIGGPVYRVGVGGGAASSCAVQGARDSSIDFGAVQRGDPEMQQKLHRVIRACVECGDANPILSIHDQGAGGNGNVLKEIVEGERGGATIFADAFELADSSVTLSELWGAEYQESDAVLIEPSLWDTAERIARRERCALSAVGKVRGDARVILRDFGNEQTDDDETSNNLVNPVDFNLRLIAERAPKSFELETSDSLIIKPLSLPSTLTVAQALQRVLRLPSVASKRFLTSKVDRSVSGLVAQQQCVGVLQTPLADVAVTALSYWDVIGAALACGEQPLKGIVNAAVGARMALVEALTNLVFAPITCLKDVKCSGNWMWAARLPGEGARLVKACDAMCEAMRALGVAVDGGKDSLSMAAQVERQEERDDAPKVQIVKAPGTLVISAYAPCTDITKVVTPDFKTHNGASSALLHLSMCANVSYANFDETRLGGSALAQCYAQIGGRATADLDDPAHFSRAFSLVQTWIHDGRILSGHDVSDGGLLSALLESAFAGNCGFECAFDSPAFSREPFDALDALKMLFSEESGLILEVEERLVETLIQEAERKGVKSLRKIGRIIPAYGLNATAKISVAGVVCLEERICVLREIWEETSDRMEFLQIAPKCVAQQAEWRVDCALPRSQYRVTFDYGTAFKGVERPLREAPRVAILREEGSNGDREMAAAFTMCGFCAFDLTMSDLLSMASTARDGDALAAFDGVAFVGGFSYADVLGSARGWAASIHFYTTVRRHFEAFRRRAATFSLGVCNGCQLMALLGFIDPNDSNTEGFEASSENGADVFLDENESGRFYSGFNTVHIEAKNKSVLLSGMHDAQLGVWCSHGEGRFTYRRLEILAQLNAKKLICLRYCDEYGNETERYPQNPNGSAEGVAGVCSPDGRHLAMMPHPDRSFLRWQCAQRMHNDDNASRDDSTTATSLLLPPFSPWIRLYQNAFAWCMAQRD